MNRIDVMVIGGGTAGVIAATQAARAGAHTLLVEKNGKLGGTLSVAGVNFPGLFHAWGEQVIAGIGWELVTEAAAIGGEALPDFRDLSLPHFKHQVRLNPGIYAALCDDAVLSAGAELLLHSMVASVEREDSDWKVTLCTKSGLQPFRVQVVIDCTGDANAVVLAGGKVTRHPTVQPGTLVCQASGYDLNDLDIPAINAAFEREVNAGHLKYTDASWDTRSARVEFWLKQRGSSSNHLHGINAFSSEGKTQMDIAGRQSLLRMFNFLKKQPGLENLNIDLIAPESGVRETGMIVGDSCISVEDYVSGRVWPDALCYSFYPIDLHTAEASGLNLRELTPGTRPTVPASALRPKGLPNFLVAGRCLSSDRLANSALRVQATSMATGQVAGVLAALSAQHRIPVCDVDVSEARTVLTHHKAIVPPSNCEKEVP